MTVLGYNQDMRLTVKIKLLPNTEQKQTLLHTMEVFNAAANDAAQAGFDHHVFSQPSIHRLCYYDLRERYGLTSQLAVRAIGKAVECFKRDKTKCPVFRKRSAVVYDERVMRFKGLSHVSLASLDGRLLISLAVGGYQESRLQEAIKTGQADLVYITGVFYLLLSIELADVPEHDVVEVIGVDFGVVNIATDSLGNVYQGADVEAKRIWFQNRRSTLQSVGTKPAKRRLKKNSKREANYRRSQNHAIARRIVDAAKERGAAIALEELKGIRSRTRFCKSQRSRMSGWSFGQLRSMVAYKGAMAGIPVISIDPRDTSRTCPECDCCDKRNRPDRATFRCVHCGYSEMADYVAALNIRSKGIVKMPMVGIVEAKAGLLLNCG